MEDNKAIFVCGLTFALQAVILAVLPDPTYVGDTVVHPSIPLALAMGAIALALLGFSLWQLRPGRKAPEDQRQAQEERGSSR